MRILVVEDDSLLSDAIVRALTQSGHAVDLARNGEEADHALAANEYHLVVLDVGLPRIDGLEVLRRLRSRRDKVPVLMVTVNDTLQDRVQGLDLGADDYLTKPFQLSELEARIRALIRRSHGSGNTDLVHGRLRFDMAARRLYLDEHPLDLSARELAVVELLLSRAGRVVTKQQIIDHLYGWDEGSSSNAVEVFVYRLRRKLEASAVDIRTVRGMGYVIENRMPDRVPLLRKQLLVWLFVPLSALLSADAVVSYWVALSFSQRAYDRTLVEIARDLTLHLRLQKGRIVLDLPEAARRVLLSDPDDAIHFEVSTPAGELAAGEPLPAAAADPLSSQQREKLYSAKLAGAPVRIVEVRTELGARPHTSRAIVRVAETQNKRTGLAREIMLSVLVPQILLILIAGVLVWIGVVHGLSPLRRVREAVALRSARDFRPVELSDVPGELRPLVHSINELLERLEAALTLQTRFIADAAHQLKTPVAALQAQLELAMRERNIEQVRESVQRAYAGLDRLARLVSQLLSLARNEPQAMPAVRLVPLDLNALAFDATTRWVPEALKKRIDLGFEGIEAGVLIQGEPGRLHELLDNLLDNAVRYTDEGGRVTVRVTNDGRPEVAVNDDGPSIPPEERERVFQRFHRLLGSPRDGSGLGLSIAREIVRLHGGAITLSDDADGIGNTFRVSFPA